MAFCFSSLSRLRQRISKGERRETLRITFRFMAGSVGWMLMPFCDAWCPGRETDLEGKTTASVLDTLRLSCLWYSGGRRYHGDIQIFSYLGLEFRGRIWDQNINAIIRFQPSEMILGVAALLGHTCYHWNPVEEVKTWNSKKWKPP